MTQYLCTEVPGVRGYHQLHFRSPADVRVIDPNQNRVHVGTVDSCLSWLSEHGLVLHEWDAACLAGKVADYKRKEEANETE